MPQLARGESRPRRSPSSNLRPSRSRARSSSGSRFFLPIPTPFLAFIETLAHFVAASIFHSYPSLPSPLLAFPAFLCAALVLLPLSARTAFRRTVRLATTPASLALIHVILLLEAVSRLGPARTLLASAAAPHLTQRARRRRPKTAAVVALAAIAALALVVHDATGGGARVGERVLKSRAGHAVTTRLQKISRSVGKRVRDNKPLKKLRERYGAPPQPPQLEQLPREPPKPQVGEGKGRKRVKRRRLLAFVKAEKLLPPQGHNGLAGVDVDMLEHENGTANSSDGNATLGNTEDVMRNGNASEAGSATIRQDKFPNVTGALNDTNARDGAPRDELKDRSMHTLRALFGVVFIVLSSAAGSAASEARQRIMHDAGDVSSVSTAVFFTSAFMLFPFVGFFWFSAQMRDESYAHALFGEVAPSGALFGLGVLAFPVLLHIYRGDAGRGSGVQSQRGSSKANNASSVVRSSSSVLAEVGGLNGVTVYSYVCVSIMLLRRFSIVAFGFQETLSFSSFLAAFMLFCISILDSGHRSGSQFDSTMRERARNSGSGDLSTLVDRGTLHRFRHLWKSTCAAMSVWFTGMRDLIVHARVNKASWQVLNFLVLQSGMATVELIYATMTHASGLISISADNFFCCIALAIGLQAIRVTTRKPTHVYTYGFSRFESVCGFANGIMLIYVAVLIALEAFERLKDTDNIAVGHTFTVCLFGMTGNILGLYFFPPESRRENHNVQGIYLHIWANTLAFASVAVSTAITAAVPVWELIDMVTATLVAVGIIALAVPLLVRSGRLLLLLVPVEKLKALTSVRDRLNNIDGVVKVSGLRVWNLSPNCLVASVRLKVANYYKGPDVEVLYKARSVFTSMGVPASQCTIQISRVEAENKAVVFFHKRSRSGFGDTGIDLESLPFQEIQ